MAVMWNLRLGQYRVRYDLAYNGHWQVTRWIKYAAEWEDETVVSDNQFDLRKAKRQMHRDLRSIRRSSAYY